MDKPIGIFDSGIGGLTVVNQIKKLLPHEHLVYFGDTARIPYGTRSAKLIRQYALEDSRFLQRFDIKLMVVACNTASSTALPYLQQALNIPVIGVVIPGAEAAARATRNKIIGVIGTAATIGSGSYKKHIRNILPGARVIGKACPLLVSLVEEGWLDTEVTRLALHTYLDGMLKEGIDTLILGCTHYPLLHDTIRAVVGENVRLIDSGLETARVVKKMLSEKKMLNFSGRKQDDRYIVSDNAEKFSSVASKFLGHDLKGLEEVDFEAFLISLAKAEN